MPLVVAVEELIGRLLSQSPVSWGDCSMVPPGECGTCRQAQVVSSSRGSTFFLCLRARTDPRFPRYPALPRWQCAGYDPPNPDERLPVPESTSPTTVTIRAARREDVPAI